MVLQVFDAFIGMESGLNIDSDFHFLLPTLWQHN